MLDIWNRARAGEGAGGVGPFLPDAGRDGVGVSCPPGPETLDDVLARTDSGDVVANDGFDADASPESAEVPFCRCDMGKSDSGCFGFRRGNRKKLDEELADCVVIVVPPCTW